jgi:hypothetical protein
VNILRVPVFDPDVSKFFPYGNVFCLGQALVADEDDQLLIFDQVIGKTASVSVLAHEDHPLHASPMTNILAAHDAGVFVLRHLSDLGRHVFDRLIEIKPSFFDTIISTTDIRTFRM